eukprot:gene8292-biopygen3663
MRFPTRPAQSYIGEHSVRVTFCGKKNLISLRAASAESGAWHALPSPAVSGPPWQPLGYFFFIIAASWSVGVIDVYARPRVWHAA